MPRGSKRNSAHRSHESRSSRIYRRSGKTVRYSWRLHGPKFPVKSYVDESIKSES